MFSTVFITVLAAASIASARMDARSQARRSNAPSTYAEGYLERYDVYHARYNALNCINKHNTDFFDKCCHPMLATETLTKDRPAECNPNAAMSSSSVKAPSSTKVNAAAAATPPPTTDDDEECEEGEEDCVCEEVEEPSSSKAPTQTPKVVKPTTTTTPKATAKATPASGTGEVHTGGVATYFYQGVNAGACGQKHSDSDYIAAIDQQLYGNSGQASQYCGKQIKITRVGTSKSVVVTVADDCPSCINANSIDLSHAAFNALATDAEGEVKISWQWL